MIATLMSSVCAVSLSVTGPAYAGGGLQRCLDKSLEHNGEPPTCTKVGKGQWVASWPDDPGSGSAGGFAFVMVLGVALTVAVVVWKVRTAQTLARQNGMDPALATQMTLLSEDGLDATYLASSLRRPADGGTRTPAPAQTPEVSARLVELKGLLDRGLVTQAEYDQRRKAIIESV